MALTVFAEKMGFFHKGCSGTSVGPVDVCKSPPPGPVPIPYTNVLFAEDLIKGSKTVKLDGEPTFLEDVSMTSKSIGDEGGCLGGSVVTGVLLKNGYFMVWSQTVYIEGLGVCRHGDMMGHNSSNGPPPSSVSAGAICQPSHVKAPVPGPVASRRAAEAEVLEATGPGDSEVAEIVPCDFEKITVKCQHSGSGDGKRGSGPFEFTFDGQIQDNLPRPDPKQSKRPFVNNIQVVAGEDARRAEKLEVELSGGPGYTCSKKHPILTLTDLSTGTAETKPATPKHTFELTCAKLELPAIAYLSPGAVIAYFYFSPKTTRRYMLEVESCGVLADGSPGFRKLSRSVEVFSSDKWKLSISIPDVFNRSYADGGSKKLEPNAKWEGQKDAGWDGGFTEGSAYFAQGAGKPPIDSPVKQAGGSISLERNSEDVKAGAKLGEIVLGVINIVNRIQSVMNFIEKFQPQVGWKFSFTVALFSGELSFEWGAKEWKDHTVFKWWKFEAAMTLAKLELQASFGVDFRYKIFTITALVYGQVSGELKLAAGCEATPDEPEWGTTLTAEFKGELGIKGALGADWLAAAGKFELGFPYEASPKIDDEEGLKIDWKWKFAGLSGTVVGSCKGVGLFSRTFEIMKPRTLGEGTFPSGDKKAKGIPSQQGAIK